MITKPIQWKASDGKELLGYLWTPEQAFPLRGVVQIVHGMAETALRYQRFAGKLTENGYVVYAFDQRGHGKTAGSLDQVGVFADHGMERLVEDQHEIGGLIRREYPQLPVLMFAHSMGSFVGQGYIQNYSDLAGIVLSGSNGKQGLLLSMGRFLAQREVKKTGRAKASPKLTQLSFGSFNKAFKPNRTNFDWLSRDNDEVDKYIADPYCGGVFSAGFFADLTQFLLAIQNPENVKKVSVRLPILLISGAKDPVSNEGKGVRILEKTYRTHGVSDLTCRLYPEARHELLNETNRNEVMDDVVGWLDQRVKTS